MDPRLNRLDHMFNPRSLAFVGATDKLGKWGFIILNNLITGEWGGKLYPVNPGRSEILGLPAYPTVRDIPGEIDLAVITVPAAAVLNTIDDCIHKGVKSVVVISAGFKEMGGEAADMEVEMVKKIRAAGMTLVGPNGQGICNPAEKLYAWMPHFFYPPAGPVAVVAQSGNVQGLMIGALIDSGMGISKGVSSGNEADLRAEDYYAYLAQDDDTKVILSYVEGMTDGRRFLQGASAAALQKPVVLLKGGRTEFGVSAARSHTGALAVSDDLFQAACQQAGVVRADTIYQASMIAASFVNRPLPRGKRVGIVTGGGGLGVLASDLCGKAGLTVPPLSQTTIDKLTSKLPGWWVPGNPVDLVAGLDFSAVPYILETIMTSGEIDALLLLFIGPRSDNSLPFEVKNEQTVKMRKMWETMQGMQKGFKMLLASLMKKTGVPIYTVSNFGDRENSKKVDFDPDAAIFFNELETACAACAGGAQRSEFLAREGAS